MTEKIFIAKESTSQQILEKLGGRIVVSSVTTEDFEGNLLKPITRDAINKIKVLNSAETLNSGKDDIAFKVSDDEEYIYFYTTTGYLVSVEINTLEVKSFDITKINEYPQSTPVNYNIQSALFIDGDYLYYLYYGVVCKINRFTLQLIKSNLVYSSGNASNMVVAGEYIHVFYTPSGNSTQVSILNKTDLNKIGNTITVSFSSASPYYPFGCIAVNDKVFLLAGDGGNMYIYKFSAGSYLVEGRSNTLGYGTNASNMSKPLIYANDKYVFVGTGIYAIDIDTLAVNKVNPTLSALYKNSPQMKDGKFYFTFSNTLKVYDGSLTGSYSQDIVFSTLYGNSTDEKPGFSNAAITKDNNYLLVLNGEIMYFEKSKNIVAWRVVE